MSDSLDPRGPSGPGSQWYEIRLGAHLSPGWSHIIEGATLRNEPNGQAVLTVRLPDQAALHGLLNRLHGYGLPLIAVNPVPRQHDPGET
jgi:hypothetical protein